MIDLISGVALACIVGVAIFKKTRKRRLKVNEKGPLGYGAGHMEPPDARS